MSFSDFNILLETTMSSQYDDWGGLMLQQETQPDVSLHAPVGIDLPRMWNISVHK